MDVSIYLALSSIFMPLLLILYPGLDRCRLAATAAAPISKETLEFFLSLGIPVFEVYGMSESTGPEVRNVSYQYFTYSVWELTIYKTFFTIILYLFAFFYNARE